MPSHPATKLEASRLLATSTTGYKVYEGNYAAASRISSPCLYAFIGHFLKISSNLLHSHFHLFKDNV